MTYFCLAPQMEQEKTVGGSEEVARLLGAPLGGAAESRPRCTSLFFFAE